MTINFAIPPLTPAEAFVDGAFKINPRARAAMNALADATDTTLEEHFNGPVLPH